MQYRRLGKSGLLLSELSYGSWVTFSNQVDTGAAVEAMSLAYEAGVNFFDNAEVYAAGEAEKIMGEALKKVGWGRDTFAVSSKVFWGGERPTQRGLSRKHIHDACHASLKRMQLDYLDLFFCHRPDVDTPIEETVRAMDVLVQQGKILYWGTSEWSAQQITEAHQCAREWGLTPPSMEQPEYNLFARNRVEAEYAPLYEQYGMGTTIWSPLASGILTGKYSDGIPKDSRMNLPGFEWLRNQLESPEGQEKVEKTRQLEKLAAELDLSVTVLAIAWCLKNPNVSTVMLGASKPSQLTETLAASEAASKLTPEVMDRIEEITQNRPSLPRNWKG
jgi:voltage-dependent potassium channel beta subunit